jgi:cell division protein FtsW
VSLRFGLGARRRLQRVGAGGAAAFDLAPPQPRTFPDTGIGHGWEAPALAVLSLILLGFGLVTLFSASAVLAQRQGLPGSFYVQGQAVVALAGVALALVVARIPYDLWRRLAWPSVVASIAFLIFIILPWTEGVAPRINGARRWLDVGFSIQPSELAKLAMIFWTAQLAVRKQGHFRSLSQGLLPFLVVWAALLFPILLQPDLSTAAVTGMLGVLILFAAGARLAHFLFLGVVFSPVLLAQLGAGFRVDRLAAYLNPAAFADGAGYQVQQSLLAVGSGGAMGVGFGQGRQKFGFLPELHNDFIFAIIGEEWGFAGVVGLVVLYVGIILVGFRIAQRAPDLFGELVAVGLTSLIALHAVLHMGVGLGLVPSTGLPLPLVSYGRSNLLVTLFAIGVLMSIARASRLAAKRGANG